MRITFTIFIIFLTITSSLAQKQDNIWLLGYQSNTMDSTFGGTVIDFSTGDPNIYYQFREMNFWATNVSISDSLNNLLFYTNGLSIANAAHDTMENGGGLNPGDYADDLIYSGYGLRQGAIGLRVPGQDSLYYILHSPIEYSLTLAIKIPLLYYSLIDMRLNNGLGAVLEKNQVIFQDTLGWDQLTTVKHANGRDWWIMLNEFRTNRYYRILISPNGFLHKGVQTVGDSIPFGLGQATFSPDGSKYANFKSISSSKGQFLQIHDFNRCEGLFENSQSLVYNDTSAGGGVAFSPDSRFLYVSSGNYIYQFDTESNDIFASKEVVAVYDGFESPFPTRFDMAQLAPNGKIYLNATNGVNILHVINHPNEQGLACEVIQHGVQLPTFNSIGIPNFPHYRLGSLDGSPCDTLNNTVKVKNISLQKFETYVYPNPAQDYLKLDIISDESFIGEWEIFDALGNKIIEHAIDYSTSHSLIQLKHLPNGVYFYKINLNNQLVDKGKILIIK